MVFTGAVNEATGESWCPDCVVAKPSIAKLATGSRKIIVGEVQTNTEWCGVATHPYKVHPLYKAGGVPSCILFEGENELHRVEDLDGFANEDLMGLFLED